MGARRRQMRGGGQLAVALPRALAQSRWKGPQYSRAEGLAYAQGPHARREKNSSLEIYSQYN